MEYGVLGPLVLGAPDATVPVGGRQRRALLAALLAHHGRTVPTDDLVDALWPDDPPPSARHTLHTHVSRLRQQLGVAVERQDDGYRLGDPADLLDAHRFDALVREAADAPAAASVDLMSQALALWRGAAYGAAATVPAVRAEAHRLEEQRAHAREVLAEGLVAVGRPAEAVATAEALVADQPDRETAWTVLVRALTAAGRPAEAATTYRTAVDRLDELGMPPSPALRAAYLEALGPPDRASGAQAAGRDMAPARPGPTVLPRAGRASTDVVVPSSSLVGREQDLEAVEALLGSARLVTLVGPGGVGKTRLALEVARRHGERYSSGVRVVELTTLSEVSSVPAAVLAALGVGTQGGPVGPALRRAGDLDLLVLLDNCEHVVDAVADVLEDLLGAGRATVLATSRERIGVPGEHVHVVGPLPTAGERSAACRLFVDRAVAAGVPGGAHALDPALVDRVVARLDGMPLAIEMAAARTATLGLPDLVTALEERLDSEVDLLRDPRRRGDERHRTLRSVIAWSEALLEPEEHRVLQAWPVFSGPVEAADAEAVLGASTETVEALVSRSLLVLVPGTGPGVPTRYRMLHTVRSALRASTQVSASVARTHARHVAGVAEDADARLRTGEEPAAVRRLTSLVAELRSAHAWSRRHDPAHAARLSRALHATAVHTLDDEVLGWAARLVPLVGPGSGLATAHVGIAARLVKAGELEAAVRHAQEAYDAAQDDVDRLQALDILADAPIYDGRFEECRAQAARLGELALEVGDPLYVATAGCLTAMTLAYEGRRVEARAELDRVRGLPVVGADPSPTTLGWLEYTAGEIEVEDDPTAALVHLRRAVSLADAAGNAYLAGVARVSVSSVEGRHGNPAEAAASFAQVVRWWLDRADRTHLVTTLRNLVDLLLRVGAAEAAAQLWGAVASSTVSRSFGPERARLDRAREVLGTHLPDGLVDESVAVGSARTLEQAAEAALSVLVGPDPPTPSSADGHGSPHTWSR